MNGNSGASWFETALRASYGCKLICLSCKRNLACMRAANWPDEQIISDFPKSCQASESKIFSFRRRANQR
jgi:hypothetical protein